MRNIEMAINGAIKTRQTRQLSVRDSVKNCGNTTKYFLWGHSVDYNLSKEYEEKARKIVCDWSISYEEQKKQVNILLAEYLQKAQEQA